MKENKTISKCCGATLRTEEICSTCLCPCEVTSMIDSPVGVPEDIKQYQEDIKAGVDVSGKTEKIQDEFMDFWDEYKDKVGLGNYSDEVTRFWFKKLSEQRQSIGVSEWMRIGKERGFHDYWKDMTRIAVMNELLEEVKGLKKKTIPNMLQEDKIFQERGMDGVKGFNQALDTVIKIINK